MPVADVEPTGNSARLERDRPAPLNIVGLDDRIQVRSYPPR